MMQQTQEKTHTNDVVAGGDILDTLAAAAAHFPEHFPLFHRHLSPARALVVANILSQSQDSFIAAARLVSLPATKKIKSQSQNNTIRVICELLL